MEEVIQMIGAMDLDSPPEVFPKGYVRSARNIQFKGVVPNMRAELVVGNSLVPSQSLPDGINLTIGRFYDSVNQRIFYFNYNSNGTHSIRVFNTLTQTFQILIQTGINTIGDPLGFTTTGKITSVNILYGDAPIGNILFYVDSLGRPTQIPIDLYLSGFYTDITRNYIEVIRTPPVMPPWVTYENDYTVAVNNLINGLWQFAYAFMDDKNEKTAISSASKLPLPTIPFDPSQNIPPSQNSRIAVFLQTGDATTRTIRIYARQTKDGSTTDWLIVQDIKKSDYGIADNTVYKFLFFNNGNYVAEDAIFAVLNYDEVPIFCGCQELILGAIAYADITEGYDYINPAISCNVANQNIPRYTVNGSLFFAATNGISTSGQPQITLYLTGVGDNDGFGNPIDLYYPPANLYIRAKSNGSDISFNYANALSGIPAILSGLQTAATSAGWSIVGSTSNSLTIYYPSGTVILQSSYIIGTTTITLPYNLPQLALYPQSAYQFAKRYKDAGGRTNGMISNVNGQITTPNNTNSQQSVEVTFNLSGDVPPAWAVSWALCRTNTLTYNKYFQWVTNAAYANTFGQRQYVYFGIGNIADYNTQISATEGVVSYGFSNGDRIRIMGRYAADMSFVALNLDYAILGIIVNPIVNGVVQTGTFIQIAYPTSDINSDFKFPQPTDSNFQNYQVLIYSYKTQNPQGQNVFYEIGEEYGIGNQGTPSAYHMGNVDDNIVKITDGDIFFRTRTIPLINEYLVPTGSYTQGSPYSTVWVLPGTEAIPIVDNGIWKIRGDTNKVAGLTNVTYPTFSDDNQTVLNESGSAFGVRIRWIVNVTDTTDPNGQWAMYFKIAAPGNIITVIPVLPLQTGLKVGNQNTYSIDQSFSLPAGSKMWLVNFAQNQMFVSGQNLQIDIIRNITEFIYDASFSDIYSLKTNSDNRPSIIDATAKQVNFPVLFRYSEPYVPGTLLNQMNRFYDTNMDYFDPKYGRVVRMVLWQKRLRIAQYRKWGEIGVYSKFIKNNTGATELIVNDQIIEQNNIQYFEGNFGIGNQPRGFAINGFQIWFVDPITGANCRLSLDGVKDIGEEFRAKTFFGGLLPKYLNNYAYQFGGNAVILAEYAYNTDRANETIFCFQGGTNGTDVLQGQSLKFVEARNSYSSFIDFAPDEIVCAENTLYTFYNGLLYVHTNVTDYATFFGTAAVPKIRFLFNQQAAIKKKYLTLAYQAFKNKIWQALNVGDVMTSFIDPQSGLQQISQLLSADQEINEGGIYGSFLYDANSMENAQLALVEGACLEGFWIDITLTAPDNEFDFLFSPIVKWIPSPKTP